MKENNQNPNPEDWYSQYYQEVYNSTGDKDFAEKDMRIAKRESWAKSGLTPTQMADLMLM